MKKRIIDLREEAPSLDMPHAAYPKACRTRYYPGVVRCVVSLRNPFLEKSRDLLNRGVCFIRHSFASLQRIEELQQPIGGSIPSRFNLGWSGFCQRGFLQGEVHMKVSLCGIHRLVPEPQRNNRGVDVGREQFHRNAVAQHMRRDALGFERRALNCGGVRVRLDKVLHAVRAQAFAVAVWKQDLRALRGRLLEPCRRSSRLVRNALINAASRSTRSSSDGGLWR